MRPLSIKRGALCALFSFKKRRKTKPERAGKDCLQKCRKFIRSAMKIIKAEFIKSAMRQEQYPKGNKPEVAFVGRSNVGKSSLINCLLERKNLVKTSKTPGCTRLINFFNINDRIVFTDLPGYGYAKLPKSVTGEWAGIIREYFENRKNLGLVVFIMDIRRELNQEDLEILSWFGSMNLKALLVITKADKISKSMQSVSRKKVEKILAQNKIKIRVSCFSSKTGQGKSEIFQEIQAIKPMKSFSG